MTKIKDMSYKELRDGMLSTMAGPYPKVGIDRAHNKWCVLKEGTAILMTGIYPKGKEPSADIFMQEYKGLCDNAIAGEIYMKEREAEKAKRKNLLGTGIRLKEKNDRIN